MNKPFVTEFKAIDPKDGNLKEWAGPTIWAINIERAISWCEENAGHLVVTGALIAEIPTDGDSYNPIWEKEISYAQIHLDGEHKTDNSNETIYNKD